MNVLAVDPGSSESAWVLMKDGVPVKWAKEPNSVVLQRTGRQTLSLNGRMVRLFADVLAIEYVRLRGMPVMQQVLDTMFWTGRFVEAWDGPWTPTDRLDVKMTLCGDSRAKDGNIRVAVIDHYGGESAIGGVRCQRCKGKGWRGRERTPCADCHDEVEVFEHEWPGTDGHTWVTKGSGWRVPPGPLHGMAGDCWQALAVGLTWLERNGNHD
jgi:hypothetical protein